MTPYEQGFFQKLADNGIDWDDLKMKVAPYLSPALIGAGAGATTSLASTGGNDSLVSILMKVLGGTGLGALGGAGGYYAGQEAGGKLGREARELIEKVTGPPSDVVEDLKAPMYDERNEDLGRALGALTGTGVGGAGGGVLANAIVNALRG